MLKHLMSGSSLSSFAVMAPADKAGGISKDDKAFLKIIRETFESDQGHDLKLTDAGILGIVQNVGRKEFEEMDGDAQIALLVKGEAMFKDIAVSDPSITGIVSKFDKAFDAELAVCIDAMLKNKSSAVDIYGQFKRLFTRDQLNEMPYPGSDKDDVKGTNYKPDIVEKKAVAGGTIRTVFTNDLVQATERGKQYQKDIDDCTAELKTSGAVPRFKSFGKQKLRDILNSATQERNGMRSMFRRSLQLHHKLEALTGMSLVEWAWIRGTDDKSPTIPKEYKGTDMIKITRSPKPLWLTPVVDGKPDHANGKEFSVSQVIAFNPTKALAAPDHGTLSDLIDSAKPEPETPESAGEKMSEETMDTTAVVFSAKLANTQARAALRQRLVQPDNDEVRASYCALYLSLQGIYNVNKKWYDEYLHGQETAQEKETREKSAAA